MHIAVLYEDDVLLAINKPAGVAVHEDGRSDDAVLTDWIRRERPTVVGVGEPMRLQNGMTIDRPGIVHRIDRDTSGIVLVAKTQHAFLSLKAQFQARTIEKHYRAFVWGTLRSRHGTIDRPIGRSKKDFRTWSVGSGAGGQLRPAITRYSLLATRTGFSYLDVEPKTGRTHQIRVHLKSIGHPVVCDERYGKGRPPALGFTRLALHAHVLTCKHPITGAVLVLEAPLPEDFARATHTFCV